MEKKIVSVKSKKLTPLNVLMIAFGSVLFALSVNFFLVPLKLYSGGIPGLSQLIRSLFFSKVNNIDLAGIINLMFNIPLFILAGRKMSKKMVIGTAMSVIIQTLVFSYAKAPSQPILDEKLSSILISGVLGGIGCGIVLTNGGSAGGMDLLGVYMTKISKKFSVGLLAIIFNAVLYTVMAILFDLQTALYSILYIAIFSIIIDNWHYQNIEVELMIFTHNKDVKNMIMEEYMRGVTFWDGKGAYTNLETEVLVTIVSKSEVESVKREVIKMDSKAFIVAIDGISVAGGYEKRLS